MSGSVITQAVIYNAVLLALRHWGKHYEAQDNILLTIQNGCYHAVEACITDYLKRLAAEEPLLHQILCERFIQKISAEEVGHKHTFSRDTIYRKQQEAIKLVARWIVNDEQTYLAVLRRETINKQVGMLHPPSYTKLIGVAQKTRYICEHIIRNADPHITLISGLGGIGKTAMTDAVVRQVIEQGEYDHVVWMRYEAQTMHGRSRDASDPLEQVMGKIATLPHIDAAGLPPPERDSQIMVALRNAPHLIVLDNIEEIEDIEWTLAHLPNYVQPSHFLITSRTLPSSQRVGYLIVLSELDDASSRELLRHEATCKNALSGLARYTDAQLATIIKLVGGNPLALKLVVGMALYMPFQRLLADLQKAQTQRSRSLYQGIYSSAWKLLSDDARSILQGMVLAADSGVTIAQMEAFSQLNDEGRFWDGVETLYNRNLLEKREGSRYGIHRLTATFLRTDILGMM